MRIIAGKHKNRVIPSLKNSNCRPSTTKFREALFSILSSGEFVENPPYEGANILDLFTGTGSLAFEALSRGAKTITLLDNDKDHLKVAKDFAVKIGEQDNAKFLLASAISLPFNVEQYSLVFMDPPYYNQFVERSLISLVKNEWLENKAIIVVEMEKRYESAIPENVSLVKEKIYGNNKLLILRYEQK
jgi:16S rRNA (guanine966-N2)-methyltransferase